MKSNCMFTCVPASLSFLFSSGHVEPKSIKPPLPLKTVLVNTVICVAVCFHCVDDFNLNLYFAEKQLKALDDGTVQDPPTIC